MSADRFYGEQKMTKTTMQTGTGVNKPKRRLKADIVKSVNGLADETIPSLANMTVDGLLVLERILGG